jgi:hypothetical protein
MLLPLYISSSRCTTPALGSHRGPIGATNQVRLEFYPDAALVSRCNRGNQGYALNLLYPLNLLHIHAIMLGEVMLPCTVVDSI